MLIRALYEHWSRSVQGSAIANLTRSFLTVQVRFTVLPTLSYIADNIRICSTMLYLAMPGIRVMTGIAPHGQVRRPLVYHLGDKQQLLMFSIPRSALFQALQSIPSLAIIRKQSVDVLSLAIQHPAAQRQHPLPRPSRHPPTEHTLVLSLEASLAELLHYYLFSVSFFYICVAVVPRLQEG